MTTNNRIELKNYERLSDRSTAARISGMVKSGPEQVLAFQTLCANAICRTIETNDVTHINRMVEASLAVGRYRTFARVVPGCIPFKWNKSDRAFSGKRQANRFKKLMEQDDNGACHFENLLVEFFGKESEFAKTTPPKSWDMDAAVLRLVRTALKEGKQLSELNAAIEKAERKVAKMA